MLSYSVSSYLSLPSKPGVYLFYDNKNALLYVGKAKNLKSRVSSYFSNKSILIGKTRMLVDQIKRIKVIIVESEIESLLLESSLIKKYLPKYNIKLTDGKAYPLIRIPKKMDYPPILTARRPEDKSSDYFGPYPNSSSLRLVLKTIRRIFPYQSTMSHSKTFCFYHHIGLCPCSSVTGNKAQYRKTIAHIENFLEGKTRKVIKDLEKERGKESNLEHFERSATLQKQIDAINLITHPVHAPVEYQTNPNLREDLREKEMLELQKVLKSNGTNLSLPVRIECYDNSNFQGINPTSSMVVLTNGEIDKSQYRKFHIRKIKGPNDFATMKEALARRLNHKEWPYPDLIIVDGGKGQISSAKEVLKEKHTNIPLIGLAKREETIITSDFKEIHLSKSSPALHLVMRIRDEAHRFAIFYHRKLRNKSTFYSR